MTRTSLLVRQPYRGACIYKPSGLTGWNEMRLCKLDFCNELTQQRCVNTEKIFMMQVRNAGDFCQQVVHHVMVSRLNDKKTGSYFIPTSDHLIIASCNHHSEIFFSKGVFLHVH